MQEKAEGALSDLHKTEGNAKQTFMMLKQFLEGSRVRLKLSPR